MRLTLKSVDWMKCIVLSNGGGGGGGSSNQPKAEQKDWNKMANPPQ